MDTAVETRAAAANEQLTFEGFALAEAKAYLSQIEILLERPLKPHEEIVLEVRARNSFTGFDFDNKLRKHILRPVSVTVVEED